MRHEPFEMLWHVAQIDLSVRHRRPNQQTRLAHACVSYIVDSETPDRDNGGYGRVCDRGLRSRAVTDSFSALLLVPALSGSGRLDGPGCCHGIAHAAVGVWLTGSRMVLSPKSATRSSRPPRAST
jgi:hypothetical protein